MLRVRSLTEQMHNYNAAVYDFSMVIDRTQQPTAADYVRRACAYCCAQVGNASDVSDGKVFGSEECKRNTRGSRAKHSYIDVPLHK